MNKRTLKHFKSHDFTFPVHAINGKKVRNRRIESKTMKWNNVPTDLAFKTDSFFAVDFDFHPCLLNGNTLGFSWRDVHSTLTNILIPIGSKEQDKWDLKKAARSWVAEHWEAVKSEVEEVALAFIESTGFYAPFAPTIKLNGTGAYADHKIIAAGDVRCLQINVALVLQEPVQFLSEEQLKALFDATTSPVRIGKFAHIQDDDQEWDAVMKIYNEAVESNR